jgi:hypothetical protein
MIHEIGHALVDPDKQTIKRAQMVRTVVQLAQFIVTLAILLINVYLLTKGK